MAGRQREPWLQEILDGIREGRITQATAVDWLELGLAGQARQVRAHATPALRDRVVKALDSALSGDGGDEFSRMFPPSAPLGAGQGAQDQPGRGLIYPGEGQGRKNRSPVSWDGYVSASAPGEMSDEEADTLYPPATAEEADRRAQDAGGSAPPAWGTRQMRTCTGSCSGTRPARRPGADELSQAA